MKEKIFGLQERTLVEEVEEDEVEIWIDVIEVCL